MARIKIPFKGVTSQSNYQDGECKNIVNLRPKKGVYKPVTPRKVLQTLNDDYDIVFVHRENDYENWIGVAGQSIYTNIETAPVLLQTIPDNINSVQQLGNTLSFVTDNDIYYALYSGVGYTFLGKIPDMVPIQMGVNSTTHEDKLFYKDELGALWMQSDLPKKKIHEAVILKARQRVIDGLSTSGTLKGVKLFDAHLVRYAYRLYDGSVIKHSPPILVLPPIHVLDLNRFYVSYLIENGSVSYDDSYVITRGFDFSISYDFTSIAAWKDIIKSVDIFISPPLGATSPEFFIDTFNDGGAEARLINTLSEVQIERISSNGLFYLSHSLELEQKTQSFCDSINKDITNIDNIIYQELMPDDSFSHHAIGAGESYMMNNRLNISTIKTRLFDGFHLNFFKWNSPYNGLSNDEYPNRDYIVHFHIKTEYGEAVVMRDVVASFFLNAYISYPDPRAYRINVYRRTGNFLPLPPYELVYTAPLKPHQSLNISFMLNDSLDRITNTLDVDSLAILPLINRTTYTEYNKIKISEINNPFVFPVANTYQVGNGRILAESSIVMNVSDRNYGMYPVFVFTTDGVFTMAGQDADTVHASIQAPTYLEPPISKVICATPYGVVFITNRGLMQISNYKTESLSEILREDDDVLNIDLAGITDPAAGYPSVSFREFLKTATSIVYNPYHDELIISASGYPYNYVYDYETKSFYLSTNLIGLMVQNTFPDVYYITDRNITDISQSGSDVAKVALLTRPLQFQSTDIKKLERIFLRALMYNAQGVRVVAYHSMDGVNFSPIKGFAFGSGGNYKDFDLGLLARETFRQYLFLLTGEVDEKSEVDYIDCEISLNYNNEKMR